MWMLCQIQQTVILILASVLGSEQCMSLSSFGAVRGLLDLKLSYLHWTCNFWEWLRPWELGEEHWLLCICSEVKPPFLFRLSELELSCANLMRQRLGEDVFCMQRYRGNAKNLIQALHLVFSSFPVFFRRVHDCKGVLWSKCYLANSSEKH